MRKVFLSINPKEQKKKKRERKGLFICICLVYYKEGGGEVVEE